MLKILALTLEMSLEMHQLLTRALHRAWLFCLSGVVPWCILVSVISL
jgi:hypothetical protein